MRRLALPVVLSLTLLCSCAKQEAVAPGGPPATVILRNGTRFAGSVVSSTPTQVTLLFSDNTTRVLDMRDVRSIDYGETPAISQGAVPVTPQASLPPNAPQPDPRYAPREVLHEDHYHPPVSVIQSKRYEVPVGAQVSVRNEETIDASRAVEGQTFAAEVTNDVLDADGAVVIPRGSNAQIVIRSSAGGGRFKGQSDLVLDLQTVAVDGQQYQLSTVDLVEKGRNGVGKNKRTAEFAGGGAALGAIIGAIAGHGKGAAIGAASGAAAGLGTQVITKGSSLRIPVETVLTFRLDRPLRVIESRGRR